MFLVRWLVLFAFTLFIALVLVLTFIQPAFKQEVGIQILKYSTKPLPVYLYVVAAFVAGLGLGVTVSIYGFIRAKTIEFRKNKQIRALEQELENVQLGAAMNTPVETKLSETTVESTEPRNGETQ